MKVAVNDEDSARVATRRRERESEINKEDHCVKIILKPQEMAA